MNSRSSPRRGADPLTAVQYGVGPIGSRITSAAVDRGFEFVGAVDVDPANVGDDLGDVAGAGRPLDVTVADDPDEALAAEPDVIFHSTVSTVTDAAPQLERALAAGADVISTCEELACPWWNHDAVGDDLDETARENGVSLLGTGINPGFAMDAFPAVLTTPCQRVDRITIERVQDTAQRRKPLQEKIGAGRSTEAFREEIAAGAGHVGLPESTAMLAAALGWDLETVETEMEPVVADEPVASEHVSVDAGEVAGMAQTARGVVDGDVRVVLDLDMYLGAPDPRDAVTIQGTADVDVRVDGGFHGDVTTPVVVVITARRVRESDPGLVTMLDLAVPSCR